MAFYYFYSNVWLFLIIIPYYIFEKDKTIAKKEVNTSMLANLDLVIEDKKIL